MHTSEPSLNMQKAKKSIGAIPTDYIYGSFVGNETKIEPSLPLNQNFIFWLEINYRYCIYKI